MNTQLSDILELSVSERIQLVEDIWDSIAEVPDALSLAEDQKFELDRRVESYRANPNDGIAHTILLFKTNRRFIKVQ